MTDYIIKSTLCLAVFLIAYIWLLEREKMHVFKRFYLLFSLVFSLTVPLSNFHLQFENPINSASKSLQTYILPALELSATKDDSVHIVYFIYGFITFILIVKCYVNLAAIYRERKNATLIDFQTGKLALVDKEIVPHTFGSTIYINKQSYENNHIESELLTHELAHVQQKHSFDILFIEILKIIFWFNPLLIFYKRAIQLNHEFLADDHVISSNAEVVKYQKLLLSNSMLHSKLYLTSNLNSFLKTKKRFIMMTKTTSTTTQLFKKLIVAPLFLAMFFLGSTISFGQVASEKAPQLDTNVAVPKDQEPKSDIYSSVEKRPEFPGGIQAFFEFVGKNYKMPDGKDLSGKVFIQFVIEKDGSLTNLKVMRDIGHGTGEEAVRVLKLSPKWIAGEQDGKKVRVLYSLPISVRTN